MKLYYTPGVCSLAPHIALREAGQEFDLIKVDLHAKQTDAGGDYNQVNRHGKVPALDIGEDTVLTENPAILQYIADRNPDAGLAPPAGSSARYRLHSWLSYLASELHKLFGPLFAPGHSDDEKKRSSQGIDSALTRLDEELSTRDYLVGDRFSVADAYLFTILGWPKMVGIDMAKYPALNAYTGRIAQREGVQAALKAEGLV
jgi:glutathione S-transferase